MSSYNREYSNPQLHIGFDISQTGQHKAGCGYFAHALIQTLLSTEPSHKYTLYPSFGDFYLNPDMPIQNPYHLGSYGPLHTTKEIANNFWTNSQLESSLNNPDIIHANNFWCPLQLQKTRLLYTLYDLGFMIDPSWTTESNRLGCFEGVFRASLHADWIISISEASKTHFLNTFPYFPEDHIRVIYPYSRYQLLEIKEEYSSKIAFLKPNHFWLSVGTIEPRKNQKRLATAYARYLALGGDPIPLVFAGMKGWLMDDFSDYLKKLKIDSHVILTGYLSDSALMWLYRHCYANLYPSLFEGFGLPVLEGMQMGAPTIASHSSSIPEITGDAAILLDPQDTEAWAQTMLKLSKTPGMRDTLTQLSEKQALTFNKKQNISKLLELYQFTYTEPKRNCLWKKND